MAIPYRINPKTFGVNGFALPYSDQIYSVTLAANTQATIAVPKDLPMGAMGMSGSINPIGNAADEPQGRSKWIAVFSYGTQIAGDVWVALNSNITVPASNNFAKSAAQLKPSAWDVYTGDTISAICSTANTTMSVAFYWIQE
jgi:hypothetical protein